MTQKCHREHNSVGSDMHCYSRGRRSNSGQPLDYLTKKTGYNMCFQYPSFYLIQRLKLH